MMKTLLLTVLLALTVAITSGCQSDQAMTAEAEPVVAQPYALEADQDEDSPLEALAFWKWFGGGDGQAEEPPAPEPEPLPKEPTVTLSDVHWDMSPGRVSRAENTGEIDNRIHRTIDTNTSAIWDDILGMFLLDRPTRLSLFPTP